MVLVALEPQVLFQPAQARGGDIIAVKIVQDVDEHKHGQDPQVYFALSLFIELGKLLLGEPLKRLREWAQVGIRVYELGRFDFFHQLQ